MSRQHGVATPPPSSTGTRLWGGATAASQSPGPLRLTGRPSGHGLQKVPTRPCRCGAGTPTARRVCVVLLAVAAAVAVSGSLHTTLAPSIRGAALLSDAAPHQARRDGCEAARSNRHAIAQPELLTNMRWLHIPKCGTSMGLMLLRHMCPRLPQDDVPSKSDGGYWFIEWAARVIEDYCDAAALLPVRAFGNHEPLREEHTQSGSTVVAMIRDPRVRLHSAYNHDRMSFWASDPALAVVTNTSVVHNVHEFAAFPGVAGCQARMLAGQYCARSKYPDVVPDDVLTTALTRLRSCDIAFVGLTDYWELSMALFHAMFGGDMADTDLHNLRPGSSLNGRQDYNITALAERDPLQPHEDAADWAVYVTAAEVFVSRLQRYGVAVFEHEYDAAVQARAVADEAHDVEAGRAADGDGGGGGGGGGRWPGPLYRIPRALAELSGLQPGDRGYGLGL